MELKWKKYPYSPIKKILVASFGINWEMRGKMLKFANTQEEKMEEQPQSGSSSAIQRSWALAL